MPSDAVLTLGFEPVESILEGTGGYSFTPHARQQMREKKLDKFDVAQILVYPLERTGNSRTATYWSNRIAVITNERDLLVTAVVYTDELERAAHISAQRGQAEAGPVEVIPADNPRRAARELKRLTAALNGGPKKTLAPRPIAAPPMPVIPAPRLSGDELLALILEPIHPALREQITRLADGDPARILVHSATRVEILPAG